MNGPKVNALTREQVRAAVAGIPPGGDYVWDGVDEDDRPLSDAACRLGWQWHCVNAGDPLALTKRKSPCGLTTRRWRLFAPLALAGNRA